MKKFNTLKTKLILSRIAYVLSCILATMAGCIIAWGDLQDSQATFIISLVLIFGMATCHCISLYENLLRAEKKHMRTERIIKETYEAEIRNLKTDTKKDIHAYDVKF